jgi:hypothetical protein
MVLCHARNSRVSVGTVSPGYPTHGWGVLGQYAGQNSGLYTSVRSTRPGSPSGGQTVRGMPIVAPISAVFVRSHGPGLLASEAGPDTRRAGSEPRSR